MNPDESKNILDLKEKQFILFDLFNMFNPARKNREKLLVVVVLANILL